MELPTNMASLNDVISKLPQKKIAQAMSALLVIYIAYVAAQATWLFAPASVDVVKNNKVAANRMSKSNKQNISVAELQKLNLFGIYSSMPVEQIEEIQDAPETRLNLTLSAAVASDIKSSAAAVIENKGKQETYGIGDTITGTRATLEQVMIDRVLIKQSGRLETLMLDGFDYKKMAQVLPPKAKRVNSPVQKKKINGPVAKYPVVVDMRKNDGFSQQVKNFRADLSQNPGKITDYLKISPKRENGAIVGYHLRPGKDPEFFKNAGLKLGDVAVQMNGFDLTVPSDAAQALMALKTEQDVSLLVNRQEGMTQILFSIAN